MPESIETLEVWRDAIAIARDLYDLTSGWPAEERFGMTSQVRRSAISVPANLAEGVGRGSPGEISRYARIARGSVYELDTLLHLAHGIGYVAAEEERHMRRRLEGLARRISQFIAYQEERRRG